MYYQINNTTNVRQISTNMMFIVRVSLKCRIHSIFCQFGRNKHSLRRLKQTQSSAVHLVHSIISSTMH